MKHRRPEDMASALTRAYEKVMSSDVMQFEAALNGLNRAVIQIASNYGVELEDGPKPVAAYVVVSRLTLTYEGVDQTEVEAVCRTKQEAEKVAIKLRRQRAKMRTDPDVVLGEVEVEEWVFDD